MTMPTPTPIPEVERVTRLSRLLGLVLPRDVVRASAYLERHGRRFLIDYGYGNAREMATQLGRERAERREEQPR